MSEKVERFVRSCKNDEDVPNRTFRVTYKQLHTRVFNVPNQCFIETILSEENGYEILDIEEIDECV